MKKAFYIYLIVSVFCSTISFSINSQKNNSEFIPSQCFSFSKAMTDSTKNSDYVSDTLFQSIKKIFLHASNTYKNNNLHVALEFYTQFVNLAISHNYEKYLWQEIRMSFSYMSSINSISLNFEESIRYLKKALEITCKYNPLDLDNIYYFLFNIAKSYYSQNDYTNSLEYYNQSEAIFSSVNSIPINKKAQLYNNLGLCYYKLGMDNESQTYLDESIRIKKILGLFDDLASSYNNIGLVSQNNEKYSEALSYFNKSLFLHDSLKNSIGSAFVNNNIGNLYLDKGSYDTSKYFYQKSLSIRKNQEKINYSDLVISYNNLSFINYKLNNLDSAMFFNGLAMDLNNQELETREQYNYFSISNYLISIADRIEINLSKYHTTNNVKYLTESFSFFQPTVKLFINQLIKYNSIFPVNIFINENKRFFDLSILSSHLLDSINIPECPRSLIVSETYKSLSLLNILSEIRTLHDDSIPFKQFGQLNKYYQWQQCLLQKEKSVSGISTLTLIDSLINNTLEIDFQKIRCLERLRDNLNNYFYNISDSIISNCKNIKDKLLLDYYISSNSIFIHTISKSKISCFVHPATKEFFHAVHKYPKSVKSIDQISTISFSKDLSVYLLSPIAKILDLFSNITIIPDQTIAEIPFESLPYTEGESVKKQYLVEKKYISYRFSILQRNYSNINPNKKYSKEFFGIAPFEQKDSSFHNLSGSAREITDITNLFRTKKFIASCLVGNSATYLNFSNSNFDAKIFHLSTHSFINRQGSQLSFLELFPVNNQANLFLPVLSSIPFKNELLLLNACETGSNLIDTSTGFVSFIRSISNISIQNYICTLWKIIDEVSYEFMMKFYENLLNGYSYNKALTLAKRQFLQSDIYNYPLFWSPFILYENNY